MYKYLKKLSDQQEIFYLVVSTDKPGRPAPPQVTVNDDCSASLTWSPPEDDGGSPITNYNVEYRRAGSRAWTKANENIALPDCSFTVKGLQEGAEFEFRVSADNRAGTGDASEPTQPIKIEKPKGMKVCPYVVGLRITRSPQSFRRLYFKLYILL